MKNLFKLSIFIAVTFLCLGAAQIKQDGSLKTFQKIRAEVTTALSGPLETAGPKVSAGLGKAIELLESEKEFSSNTERRLLKASISQLQIFRNRTEFIGPKKARQINEALALAEERLVIHLKKSGRV